MHANTVVSEGCCLYFVVRVPWCHDKVHVRYLIWWWVSCCNRHTRNAHIMMMMMMMMITAVTSL